MWSYWAQKVFDLVKSTSKCRHFGSRTSLTGNVSIAGCNVKSRTRWFCCSHIYLFLCERLRKQYISSQEHCKGNVATQQTYRRYYASGHTDLHLEILKRRNVESDGSISWKCSLRSWRDFARECFCFGSEAVNGSGKAVGGLVKSRVEFTRGFAAHEFLAGFARDGTERLRRRSPALASRQLRRLV